MRKDKDLGRRMLGAMMRGVSTREYNEVLPRMADTVGVSKSVVSRQAIRAGSEQLRHPRRRTA